MFILITQIYHKQFNKTMELPLRSDLNDQTNSQTIATNPKSVYYYIDTH